MHKKVVLILLIILCLNPTKIFAQNYYEDVKITVNSVETNKDGTYTAHLGYINNSNTKVIPIYIYIKGRVIENSDVPTILKVGEYKNVFYVKFKGDKVSVIYKQGIFGEEKQVRAFSKRYKEVFNYDLRNYVPKVFLINCIFYVL
ncbi:Hypothetical protein CM240_0971 [Clostridium bornimense]|uniref:Secreted protein n=1 Tax=Clostridium bornimense TaxID=1216932 RepID=W6SEP0_9CLOT|nr:hypothetical protein [Clostridium bornimense]CDM68135.1 Hypothetical protein CM240_0971 [Clostridium bornimense]